MAFKKMDKTGEVTEARIRKTVILLDADDDGSIPLQAIEKVTDMIVEEADKIDATAIRYVRAWNTWQTVALSLSLSLCLSLSHTLLIALYTC